MTINSNMIQFVQMMRNMNMLEGQANQNPMTKNLLQLAKNNNTKEIENIAKNVMKEQGLNFDEEFNNFKQMFGF